MNKIGHNRKGVDWVRSVKAGRATVEEAVVWFFQELEDWDDFRAVEGNLIEINQYHPGYVEYYDRLHGQVLSLKDRVEKDKSIYKTHVLKRLSKEPPTNVAIDKRTLPTWADADPDVIAVDEILDDLVHLERQFSGVLEGLKSRGITIRTISQLRMQGMHEVEV